MNRKTRRLPRAATLVGASVAVLVFAFGAGPLIVMFAKSWFASTLPTTPSTAPIDARQATLLARTLALSFSATLLATLLGTLTGYCLGATTWRGKTLARTLLILLLAIPPYFHAIAWTTLLRPRGFVTTSLAHLLDLSPSIVAESLYSFPGAVFVLALAYFPLTMLFCEKSLGLASHTLEETAQLSGATPWQTFCVARWPFIRPALASSAMITFLLVSADLGVSTLLKVRVFNFEVLTRIGAFNDVTSAALLSVPLLLVGFLVVLSERRFNLGKLFQPDVQDLEPPKPATQRQAWGNRVLFATVVGCVLVLPFSTVMANGWNADAMVRMSAIAWQPILNTLLYAVSASLLITGLAFTLAWIHRHAPARRLAWTDGLLMVGFAIPGTLLALALLSLYDQPPLSRWVSPVVLVIAALVVRYLIVGYRLIATSVAHLPDELLEASALDGAGSFQTLRYLLVPLTRVATLGSLAIAFVLAAGEIGSTILLYPPNGETLPITLYSIEANSPRAYVSAMTLIQLLVLLLPLVAMAILVRLTSKHHGH